MLRILKKRFVAPKKQSVQVSHHEAVVAQSEDNKVEVAVRAVKDTWIQVKADDKDSFRNYFKQRFHGNMES